MRMIGFAEGLVTVKATAQEIINKGINIEPTSKGRKQ